MPETRCVTAHAETRAQRREALAAALAYWYPDAGTGQAHTQEEHLTAADAILALPEFAGATRAPGGDAA